MCVCWERGGEGRRSKGTMLRNLHHILKVKGRIAELKEEVIFVLLEDHLSCCVESHYGLSQRGETN